MSNARPGAPGRRLRRDEAAADTRERLLTAAREVFVRRGYQAASIYEIAEAAGYTIGALYGHFGGKEDLFLEVLDRHFAGQLQRFAGELSDTSRPALEVAGEFWTSFLEREPDVVILFVEFWSVAMRDPKVKPRFARSHRRVRNALAQLIDEQRQQAHVTMPASSTDAAIVFDALIDGFALHKLADPNGVPDQLIGQAMTWMAAGMTAEEKPAGPQEPPARRRGR